MPTLVDVCEAVLGDVSLALTEAGSAGLNRQYIAAGSIAWDDCCGQLVVAPERVFKSMTFPIPATDAEQCSAAMIVVSVVVLLVRCVSTVDEMGNAPDEATMHGEYATIMRDAATVWNAVSGASVLEALGGVDADEWERTSVEQSFVGAEGGCIGVETRLMIGVPSDEWC